MRRVILGNLYRYYADLEVQIASTACVGSNGRFLTYRDIHRRPKWGQSVMGLRVSLSGNIDGYFSLIL